ncbi:type II secretion system protein [Chitinimonas sp. PSY-7]|uniref:prepilin-type N-terminal cleavage/methylation domain-containing protein n=1 Tax=Chitinimonas sp. PSY-7 TaxID=3459088 RepID=UPI00403FE068
MRKHHGFTLAEIATVLVIMGFIFPMIWGLFNTQMTQSRVDATKGNQELLSKHSSAMWLLMAAYLVQPLSI